MTIAESRNTTYAQGKISVSTSSVVLVPFSPSRIALLVGSPAAVRVTLSWQPDVVIDEGITLYPAGEGLKVSALEFGTLVRGPVYVISASGTQSVHYIEVLSKAP